MKRSDRLRIPRPRVVATAVLTMLVPLIASASAAALGTPVTIGTEVYGGGFDVAEAQPSVAVDATGTAYIAWAAPNVGGNTVQYCVLPVGATACAPSGSLTPASAGVGNNVVAPKVLIDDGIVSIIAYTGISTSGGSPAIYADEPLEEWQAPDGSASFTPVDGGQSPAESSADGDAGILEGAVDVPGMNELGVLWIGGLAPSFSAFPLVNPPQCSTTKACASATLEPESNPDQIGPFSGESVAAGDGPNPGILAVFPTDVSTGPLGCPEEPTGDHDGTAFAYGSGLQSATNDYNVSPGSPDSAWQVPVTQLDCQHEYDAVTGGPGGFGVLENTVSTPITPHSTLSITYLPFDQSTLSFDKPSVTVVPAPTYAEEPSLSQDSNGAIYAVYDLVSLDGSGVGPLVLSYSDDGGATWQGPGPLLPVLPDYIDNLTSSVGADGDGWATFVVGDSIEAVQFDATDAATPLSAAIATPSTSNAGVTLPVTCTVVPCTVSTTLTSTAPATTPDERAARVAKPVALGTGKVTITKSGRRKLVVHLTAAGRRRLKAARRTLTVTLAEGTKLGAYTAHHTVKLTLPVPGKHR